MISSLVSNSLGNLDKCKSAKHLDLGGGGWILCTGNGDRQNEEKKG